MSSFRIPKREVEARILLEGSEEISGKLFAPRHGPHGEPGTIEDRLNETKEPFLPVVRDDETLFVSTDRILCVTIPGDEVRLLEDDDEGRFDLDLRLAGGTRVRGTVSTALPAEESRLLDFLNSAPRFITVRTEAAVVLVNRTFVVSVGENG